MTSGMKKIFAFISLFFSFAIAYGQNWETVRLDSAVSVKVPKGYELNTKEGKTSLTARSPFGTILVFKTPDVPQVTPDIERDRHLKKFYDDYIKRIRNSSKDGVIS